MEIVPAVSTRCAALLDWSGSLSSLRHSPQIQKPNLRIFGLPAFDLGRTNSREKALESFWWLLSTSTRERPTNPKQRPSRSLSPLYSLPYYSLTYTMVTATAAPGQAEVILMGCGAPNRGMGWYHAEQMLRGDCPSAKLCYVVEPWFLGGGK